MIVRISGIVLPEQKRIGIALTRVHGIGRSLSSRLLTRAGVDPMTRTKDLTEGELVSIRSLIEESIPTEGELRRDVQSNIRRLKEIGSYRGARHAKRLPARGQRTRTNSRTVRGNVRRTTLSGKRAVEKK